MASSLLLVLLLAVTSNCCSCYLSEKDVILRHITPPWIFDFEEDTEDFRRTLPQPWIAVDQHRLTTTLANTPGFRTASAILQQHERLSLRSLILLETMYQQQNGTKLYIPNCEAITIYISPLDNETQGIINDLRSGRRHAVKQFIKTVKIFNAAGLNVNVSHPFIYSEEGGAVVVHGGGFGALESQINNLSLYGPREFRARHDGIGSPPTKEEQDLINKLTMKIEMVIVANIVPTQRDYDYPRDSDEWHVLNVMYGDAEKAIAKFKQSDMPYLMTTSYALHF